ncbi:MAG: archaellin/type IV pilin N-terminal domain-containing protein [Thermofilaceae archaeon]
MARRRAISPVIATVIIVAVTIAVAIAVAFWMTGIIGLFTGFEQLQIISILDDQNGIQVTVKNTGTSTASITDIYINGRACVAQKACNVTTDNQSLTQGKPIILRSGEQKVLKIQEVNQSLVGNIGPGVSVEIKLLTASGKEYPKLIVLQEYTPSSTTGTSSNQTKTGS